MAGEWRRHEVSDLLNASRLVIGDGYRAKNEELASNGLPFARAGNINDGFRFEDADHFPEQNLARVGNKISQPGDVVFTSKGTVGRFAFVRPETKRFVYSPQLCFWRSLDREKIDPRFLYYWMYGREFFIQFMGVAGQTDMAEYVSLTDQRRMHITLPDVGEQRAIARILGTLDDKIELNRRMNETLEAMARALFKSWFVDFLPVRAKMAAKERDPSLLLPQAEPNTWYVYAVECNDGSLYIGQTEDLRQRWLQHVGGKGASWTKQHPPVQVPYWEKQPSREAAVEREHWLKTGYGRKWLKQEIAARTQTGDPVRAKAEGRDPLPAPQSKAARQAGGLPKHLADLFSDSFEDSELGEIPRGWEVKAFADTIEIVGGGTPRTSVAEYWHGDIPWFSVVDAPTDSEVWVVDTEKKVTRAGVENSSTRVLPVGTTIISARGTVGRIALVGVPMAMNQSCYGLRGQAGTHGFFNYFSTRELVARLQQHAHGSVFDTITRDTLAGVSVVAPPAALIEEFEKQVAPSLQCIRAGLLETRTLAALRDSLLPKLISGELRVKDGDRLVEARVY